MRLFNHPIKQLFLMLAVLEVTLLGAAFYLGVHLRFAADASAIEEAAGPLWLRAGVFVTVIMLSMVATGLYNRRMRDGMAGVLVRLCLSFVMGIVGLSVVFYVLPDVMIGRGALALGLLISFVFVVLTRMFFMDLLEQRNISRRILVMGAGKNAATLSMLRRKSDLIGFSVVGYLPGPGEEVKVPQEKLLAAQTDLCAFVREQGIDLIIVAVDDRRGKLPMRELLDCRTQGVDVVDLVSFLEQETGKLKLDVMHPGWLTFSSGFRNGFLRGCVKRSFDIAVSLAILVLTLPLTLATAIAILIEGQGRGPIFYRQNRVGEDGKEFPVYKFRSMRPDAEKDGQAQWAKPGDARVTRVGRIIRKYRIDELPQVLNILRGDMSFVGPRPERPEFVSRLNESLPYYRERHRVKPGLTGWAQICYPYGASEEDAFEKLQFDLYYVKNHSLFLDLTVLLQTAEVVLWGKGAR